MRRRFFLLGALLALAAAAVAAERGQQVREVLGENADLPSYHALIIGINEYRNWQQLRQAREDAEALAGLLRRSYGFSDVRTLFDAQATRSAIVNQLYALCSTLGPSDALLVYYAGHGFFDRRLDSGYWIPVDGPEPVGGAPNVADWIQDVNIKDLLAKTKARQVLVLSDACFSGALLRGIPVSLAARENAYYRTAIAQPTRWCITAGDLETVPDESVFSSKVLQVLQYPLQPVFAGSDIAGWIKKDVAELTGRQPRFGPMKTVSSSEAGEFVFVLTQNTVTTPAAPVSPPATPAGPVAVTLTGALEVRSPEAGTVTIDGGQEFPIESGKALKWNALPVGVHEVVVACAGKPAWRQRVDVREGATASVAASFRARPGEAMTEDLGGGVAMEFVWIPPGEFLMGSADGEGERTDKKGRHSTTAGPQHRVTISKGFWMGKYEVTQEQWEQIMGDSYPSRFNGASNPVERVSWDDCQEFLRMAKGRFRLPTEAEWEYACRAGTMGLFAGNVDAMGWAVPNSGNTTHPVGQKAPNAWGLYDMHGNVWEWCQDWYGDYSSGAATDPTGPSSGFTRVLRGGGWSGNWEFCRSARRLGYLPATTSDNIGFRVVCVR